MTKKYKEVPGSKGARRAFTITVGLQEGYGEKTKIHSIEEAVQTSLNWMKAKAAAGLTFLTGSFVPGTVVYAWSEGDGKAGGEHEPNVTFEGEISPLYGGNLSNEQVTELLSELASELGNALGQTRVYLAYLDQVWILQAEDSATPTGETVS